MIVDLPKPVDKFIRVQKELRDFDSKSETIVFLLERFSKDKRMNKILKL